MNETRECDGVKERAENLETVQKRAESDERDGRGQPGRGCRPSFAPTCDKPRAQAHIRKGRLFPRSILAEMHAPMKNNAQSSRGISGQLLLPPQSHHTTLAIILRHHRCTTSHSSCALRRLTKSSTIVTSGPGVSGRHPA